MNFQKVKFLVLATLMLLYSCGDDDEANTNLPPVIEDQSFNASESANDDTLIGTVQASDPEQDALTFSITENNDNLFEINDDGELSLTTGSTLDFETATSHTLTVSASDGTTSASASITITVVDVNENVAPAITDQAFEVAEDISDTDAIGTVMATDGDGDALIFSITEDADELFEITAAGVLSLRENKSLDFETKTSHVITVQVSDGSDVTTAVVTITVNNVIDVPFITTWETTMANEAITIPVENEFELTHNYNIDWGDGSTEEGITGNATHTYVNAGAYQVSITGDFPTINFGSSNAENRAKIQSIDQWGEIEWQQLRAAFIGCSNLTYTALDNPDLSRVDNLSLMFSNATSFNGDLSGWNLSTVTRTSSMFEDATSFNGNISTWDMSNVTDVRFMFGGATSFNGDLSDWNLSSATSTAAMFSDATSFNGDISNWNMSNITDMSFMFSGATSFNRNIGNWDLSSATNLNEMFQGATSFNQDISGWSVGSVIGMRLMFSGASSFNQDISGWDVSSVTSMQAMFSRASSFNQDISNWDVSNVTTCFGFAQSSALTITGIPSFTNCTLDNN